MKRNQLTILLSFICILVFSNITMAQVVTNTEELMKISKESAIEYNEKRAQAEEFATKNDLPISFENDKGIFFELQYISEEGVPMYYKTDNSNAAKTISTNKVYSGGGAGLDLDGTGMTPREWDGGGVRLSHNEYGGRVTQGDSPSGTHWHSTHVAGTIMAAGVNSSAKGMAYNANLRAFDWNADDSEMASEAAAGALVSNHSYGFGRGWSWTGTGYTWYGTPAISNDEDYKFGFYDTEARNWDMIAVNAPYYLIVKSAGNDRNEGPNGGSHPKDGPYDCIAHGGIAKNTLTVGAVNDISGGYTSPSSVSMSSFSSWGPADDGRVKPDIVANGVGLYSTDDASNSSYTSSDGTSMSAPSATGSLILLQEHWENLVGTGQHMLAATLKGLVIHTADEAGIQDGPDYQYGWGLMNTKNAALRISEDQTMNVIDEVVLEEGGSYEMILNVDGTEDVKVTISWTDVPGMPTSAQLDPLDPMLVNDLDLRVILDDNTYYPWKLNPSSPGSIATNNSKNNVDNVEVVWIENAAAGAYRVIIDHDGTLDGGSQAFSIIVSGVTGTISLPIASAGIDMDVCEDTQVQLAGNSTNSENTLWRSMGDGTFDDPTLLDALYTLGTSDIETGSVDIKLTAYGILPSTDSISDNIILTVIGAPMAEAGEDIVLCGDEAAQLAGVAENYESTIWISRGDGEFDDPTKLDAIYTPGPTDIADGEVKLSLTANVIEPCIDESKDDMYITFGIAPIPMAGDDGQTCGNMPFSLEGSAIDNDGVEWSTSGDGTFDDATSLTANYTPGANDMATGTVDIILTALPIPPCTTPSTDIMTLAIEQMPDINAGDDLNSCGNNPVQLTGTVENPLSIEWTTSGDGTFDAATSISTNYTPGANDVVIGEATLRMTVHFADGCEMGFDEVVLGVMPVAVSYAGENDSVCKDGAITLAGEAENFISIQWSTAGDGTFTDASVINTDYSPGTSDISAGSTVLTLSVTPDAPCSEVITSNMTLLVLDCSAIGENPATKLGFSIIPNPANRQFVISIDEIIDENITVRIIGLDGKTVYNREFDVVGQMFNTNISTSSFPNGIYSVLVSSESKAGVSRLVIQH